MTPYPFRQGDLDGMCGVYAVVNAVRTAAWSELKLHHPKSQELYFELLATLEKRQRLLEVITEGTSYSLMHAMLRTAKRWLKAERGCKLTHERPFGRGSVATPGEIRRELKRHLGSNRTAIVLFSGALYHWTAVKAVSGDGALVVTDSGPRRRITISRRDSRDPERVVVCEDLYLLSLD